MDTIITHSLTPEQQEHWLKFWESSPHSHPRQHYVMGQIEIAKGRKPVYAFGIVESKIVISGIFSIRPLWFENKFSLEAVCYSGPIIDDPKYISLFFKQVIGYFKKLHVGKITITPYWFYPEAVTVKDELIMLGFSQGSSKSTGIVDLNCSKEELLKSFSKKVRKQIRKMEQFESEIKIASSVEDAKPLYYSLLNMRLDRGIKRMSWPEFKETFNCLNKNPKLGLCVLMNHENNFLTGRFLLCGPVTAHGLGYVVNRQIANTLPNITVGFTLFWWCFCWAHDNGYKIFDLEGYSDNINRDHPLYSVYHFKGQFRPRQVYRLEPFCIDLNRSLSLLLYGLKTKDKIVRRFQSIPIITRKVRNK